MQLHRVEPHLSLKRRLKRKNMRMNLAQTKSMKRYLVYTTADSRTRSFDPTRLLAFATPQNRRFRPPVEKVRLTFADGFRFALPILRRSTGAPQIGSRV